MKKFIDEAQSNILEENPESANVNLNLAIEEYIYQSQKLANAKKISLVSRLKENAVIFTAIAGALITFFTLYELLKRKKENIATTIHHIKHRKPKKRNYKA